jgi:hypothetical protein
MGELSHMRLLVIQRHSQRHCPLHIMRHTRQVRSLQAEVLEAQKSVKSLQSEKQQREAALEVSQVSRSCFQPLRFSVISSFFLF